MFCLGQRLDQQARVVVLDGVGYESHCMAHWTGTNRSGEENEGDGIANDGWNVIEERAFDAGAVWCRGSG
jgi:hypothetical protein